jgi:hypothetical protein
MSVYLSYVFYIVHHAQKHVYAWTRVSPRFQSTFTDLTKQGNDNINDWMKIDALRDQLKQWIT